MKELVLTDDFCSFHKFDSASFLNFLEVFLRFLIPVRQMKHLMKWRSFQWLQNDAHANPRNVLLKTHLMKHNVKHTSWIAIHIKELTVSEVHNHSLPNIWDLQSERPGSQPTKSALKREPEKTKRQSYYMNHFVPRLTGELSKPKCVYKCTYQNRCIASRIQSGAFESLDSQVDFKMQLQQEFPHQ